jgi:tetratricopeptide (TPR) repeat protein
LSELDSLAGRFLRLNQDPGYSLFVEATRALAIHDTTQLHEIALAATRMGDDPLMGGVLNAPVFTKNLDGARILLATLIDPQRPRFVRAAGHLSLAHLEVARGRWTAAQQHLDEADALRGGLGLAHRAYLATLPWLRLPSTELAELRAAVTRWSGSVPSSGPFSFGELFLPIFLEPHAGSHIPIKLYLEGLLSAALEDVQTVLSYGARLDREQLPARAGSFATDAALTLRALALEIQGNDTSALSELEAAEMRVTYPLMFASPFHSRARHRYLRADLLARLGQEERALEWYATIADQAIYDLVYLAPAALRQGEIYERLGDLTAAAEHYRRFVQLWQGCDPELRPMVEEVERRLARLMDD